MTDVALLAHIISQTQSNISILQAHAYLKATDAADIQTKLATASASGGRRADNRADNNEIVSLAQRLSISPSVPTPTPPTQAPTSQSYQSPPQSPNHQRYQPSYQPPPHPTTLYPPPAGPPVQTHQAPPPPPPSDNAVRARALWAYNEDGREPNDLTFSAGDTIEIVKEVNSDWWEGRTKGRQGLFPSNYVEKLPPQAMNPDPRAYKPFMAAHHGADAPPPPLTMTTNSVGLQEAEGQEQKKSKFGQYGNTIAHSAAGGLGFGAGAAVGGGIINSIF